MHIHSDEQRLVAPTVTLLQGFKPHPDAGSKIMLIWLDPLTVFYAQQGSCR